jgi:peptidyl-prolyl cis-trans isomerase D
MLQQMRKIARSRVAGIVLVGIAASFTLWGIGDVIRGGSTDTSVASVGSTKIAYDLYAREYKNAQRNVTERYCQLTPEQAKTLNIADRTLQSMISRAAMDDVVNRLGLTVGDAQVSSIVKSDPSFNGPLGTFDRGKFQQLLAANGFTEQGYIEYMRDNIVRQQILSAARNGFAVPPGFARALFAYLNEHRAVQYVEVTDSAIAAIPNPTDAQLNAFITRHPDRFSVPAYRAITYASVGPDDVAATLKVSDLQISQEYDRRKDDPQYSYIVPEKRDVEQLNFPNEVAAKAARAKLDGGMAFADLAKSMNSPPIALGEVTSKELGERGTNVFALKADGVTQPLKNLAGYVLLHVTKIVPGSTKTLADVKEDIRKDLLHALALSKIGDIANDYIDKSSGGLSLNDAAKKAGMHVTHVPAVDAHGLAPDGTKAAVPADAEFQSQMFKAEVNQEGDPFQTKDGHEYVLNVDSETPSKLKPLAAVRDQATAMWLADEKQKAIAAKAKALADQATKAHSLDAVATALNAQPKSSAALERDKASGDLPLGLVAAIFTTPPGASVSGISAKGGVYIVARVTGVQHRPPPVGDPNYDKFIAQVSSGTADDIATSVALAERDKQGVTINQKQVDQATGNGNEGS